MSRTQIHRTLVIIRKQIKSLLNCCTNSRYEEPIARFHTAWTWYLDVEYYGNQCTWIITNGNRRTQWSSALSAGRDYGRLLSWCFRNALAIPSFPHSPDYSWSRIWIRCLGPGDTLRIWPLSQKKTKKNPVREPSFPNCLQGKWEKRLCPLVSISCMVKKKYFQFPVNLSFQGGPNLSASYYFSTSLCWVNSSHLLPKDSL